MAIVPAVANTARGVLVPPVSGTAEREAAHATAVSIQAPQDSAVDAISAPTDGSFTAYLTLFSIPSRDKYVV